MSSIALLNCVSADPELLATAAALPRTRGVVSAFSNSEAKLAKLVYDMLPVMSEPPLFPLPPAGLVRRIVRPQIQRRGRTEWREASERRYATDIWGSETGAIDPRAPCCSRMFEGWQHRSLAACLLDTIRFYKELLQLPELTFSRPQSGFSV